MRILITGGAGFIGGYFSTTLIAAGHEVVSIDLSPPSKEIDGVEYVIGDIRNRKQLESLAKGCSAVVHLAAAHHDFGIDDATFESVNVAGSQTLCDVMSSVGINRVCFFSTVAVYGPALPPIDETTSPNPVSPYGITKLKAERVFEKWTEGDSGRRSLIIRPTVTFGAENFANMFTLIKQIDKRLFLKVGQGTNYKSLSYVENIVASAIQIWIGDKPQTEPFQIFNYIDKPDLTSDQIADIIYQELDRKPPRFRVPYGLARLLVLPFDLVIAMTGKNLPISGARIKKLAKSETRYESQKILDHGVTPPIPLKQGLHRMAQWYLKTGKNRSKSEIRRSLPSFDPQK